MLKGNFVRSLLRTPDINYKAIALGPARRREIAGYRVRRVIPPQFNLSLSLAVTEVAARRVANQSSRYVLCLP